MFAPKVAKAPTKTAESPIRKLAPQPSTRVARPFGGGAVEQARMFQGTIGNQATLRDLTHRHSNLPTKGLGEDYPSRDARVAGEVPTKAWNFSKIPLFPPDRVDRPEPSFPLAATRLPYAIQTKPVIGELNDPLEREADRIADQMTRTLDTDFDVAAAPAVQRLQAPAGPPAGGIVPASVHDVLRSSGQRLDDATLREFEPRFGQDFSEVRVHSDAQAAAAARSVDAAAFAFGRHIVFGEAQSVTDRRLLAHELTHVVQQSGTKGAPRSFPVTRPGEARPAIARWPVLPNLQLGPGPPGPQLPADAQMVDLAKIEYSQADVSFTTRDRVSLGRMAANMRKEGWDISRPADVVKMNDGRLVSLDHRRLWAAQKAGITQVSARVHSESEEIAADKAEDLKIGKGRVPQGTNPRTGTTWKAGDKPGTWGEAVRFRSAGQSFSKVGRGSTSGFDPTALPGGGVRDPSFPATGSKDMPMRVQPGPLEQRIDPTAGGSIIQSGGVRRNVPTGKIVKSPITAPQPSTRTVSGQLPPGSVFAQRPIIEPEPSIIVADPALRGQATIGTETTHIESGTGIRGQLPPGSVFAQRPIIQPEPPVIVADPALRGQAMKGTGTTYFESGTGISGQLPPGSVFAQRPIIEPEPSIIVADPALRGQATIGTETTHVESGTGMASGAIETEFPLGMAMAERAAMIEFAVWNVVLPLLFYWMEEGLEADRRKAIANALQAAMPEIQGELIRHGVAREPWGEFAAILQQTKGGRVIYANVSCKIELEAPPELRFYLVNLKLSMTNINRYDGDDHYVVSFPVYTPNALATELLGNVPDAV